MSSLGQSILMALTVTVNKYASSNVQAVHKRQSANPTNTFDIPVGRRGIIMFTTVVASQVPNSRTQLLQKYLKKSEENKAKNDKERLDSYYKRNYKDYFDFVEGSLKDKQEQQLSESEKGILDWLQKHK